MRHKLRVYITKWQIFLCLMTLGGCNSFFYYPDSNIYIQPHRLKVDVDPLVIPSSEGVKLSAWLLSPSQTPKGVVVQFHGNGQNMTAHVAFVYWLALHGYYVVTFDYRGYGDSSSTPDRRGVVDDGVAVLTYVLADARFTHNDIFVFGQSIGGAIAIPALARVHAPRIKGLILESTFSSYRAMARNKLQSSWITWPFSYPLSFLVSDDYSPVDDMKKLNIPTLFIHGDADPVVPIANVQALFNMTGSKKAFWTVQGGKHLAAFAKENSPWREKLLETLEGWPASL